MSPRRGLVRLARIATSQSVHAHTASTVCICAVHIAPTLTGASNNAGQAVSRVLHLLQGAPVLGSVQLGAWAFRALLVQKLPKREPGTFLIVHSLRLSGAGWTGMPLEGHERLSVPSPDLSWRGKIAGTRPTDQQ